ncbi:MAG: hypothetical protein ACI9UK_000228 [Candidatus Krumholzibacteriia bacterium]
MKSGLSDLNAEYRSMLKATEVEELLDLVLFRPLAFGLVKVVQPTPITPNQITFVSLIMGLASGYCYWQGTPQYLLWGAILLFLTNLFDCADGMLARVRKSSSLTGYLFDGLVDYTTNTAVIVGMLHGLSVTGASPAFIWLIGVPAGLSYAWWCARVDRFRNEWMDKVYQCRRDPKVELAEMRAEVSKFPAKSHRWDRLMIGVYGLYVKIWYSAPLPQASCPGDGVTLADWRQKRRPIMQAAVFLGPTMHLSLMMLAGAFNRVDAYLWFAFVGGTTYGLAVLLWRALTDRQLEADAIKGECH